MPTSSQLVQCSNTDNFTVVVEGNIGCGKSSFLDYFDKYDDVEIYPEPVEKWMDLNGYNTLNLMYTDPKRWSFAFQSYVQLSMLQHHKAPHTKRVKIIERSIISGKNIFIKNLYQMGNVTVVERDILDEWVKYIMNMDAINVDLIVYLKTDPEVCLNRIKSRCRDEECNISMEYIEALNTLHDDWLITNNGVPLKSRILILDADKDIEEIEKEFEKYKHIILNL